MTPPPRQAEGAYQPPHWDGVRPPVNAAVQIAGQFWRLDTFLAWGGIIDPFPADCPKCHGAGEYPAPPFTAAGQPTVYPRYLCDCAPPRWGPDGPPPLGAGHHEPPMNADAASETLEDETA